MNILTDCSAMLLRRRLERVSNRMEKLTGRPRMAALGEKTVLSEAVALLATAGELPTAISRVAADLLRAETKRELEVLRRRVAAGEQVTAVPGSAQARAATSARLAIPMLEQILERIAAPPAKKEEEPQKPLDDAADS